MTTKSSITKAYPVTTTPTRLEPYDARRVGLIIQNQAANGAAKIYVATCPETNAFRCIELAASSNLYEDIITPTDEIWAWTDAVGGATVSVTLRY